MLIPGVVAASLAAVPAGPLSVTITFPGGAVGGADTWTNFGGTVSVSGGTEPYNYAWTVQSGSDIFSIINETTANPILSMDPLGGNPSVARLTVTDSAGSPAVEFDEATVTAEQN